MVVEVISLLSSSPSVALSLPSSRPLPSRTVVAAAPPRAPDHVDDNLQSTTATPPRPRRRQAPKRAWQPALVDFLSLSEDDDSGDLSSESKRLRGAKRLPPQKPPVERRSSGSGKRENMSYGLLRRPQTLAESIDSSSSPSRPTAAGPRREPRIDSDDPFASPLTCSRPKPTPLPQQDKQDRQDRRDKQTSSDKASTHPTADPQLHDPPSDPFASPIVVAPPAPPSAAFLSRARPLADLNSANARQPMLSKMAAWDPISSSDPQPRTVQSPRSRTSAAVIAIDDSDPESDVAGAVAPDIVSRRGALDSDDEFPDLGLLNAAKYGVPRLEPPPAQAPAPHPGRRKAAKTCPSPGGVGKEERARLREQKAAEREADRQKKQQEREEVREKAKSDRARAAALAEANRRTDKKVATREMIVLLPSDLPLATAGAAETFIAEAGADLETWDPPCERVVAWRRKVTTDYNPAGGYWEPAPSRLEDEKHVLAVVTAAEFVARALDESNPAALEAHVDAIAARFPQCTVLYLLEGLTAWMRKNRSLRNRQFTSAVRGVQKDPLPPAASPPAGPSPSDSTTCPPPPPPSSQPPSRRRKKTAGKPVTAMTRHVPEDVIEDALLRLQIMRPGVLIHHTSTGPETAQWIATFTQHVATARYRRRPGGDGNGNNCGGAVGGEEHDGAVAAGFCMDAGQVRSGDGPRDTYVRILQEVARVTAPIAYGIAEEFDSVGALVAGLEGGGPLALEGVRKSANRDGVLTDRTVGQAVSRRIYKVFTGRDETSTDV